FANQAHSLLPSTTGGNVKLVRLFMAVLWIAVVAFAQDLGPENLAAPRPEAPAVSFRSLLSFDGVNGGGPVYTAILQGPDGAFYGTTLGGGTNLVGTVFKVTSTGAVTVLYSFCPLPDCSDGALPYGGLVLATDGNFYGTTSAGGANGDWGTIFK